MKAQKQIPTLKINLKIILAPTLTLALLLNQSFVANGASKPTASVVTPYWEFTDSGRVLGPSDVGVPAGSDLNGVSDESVITLPDGRIRMYFNKNYGQSNKFGIMSAISSDGLHFSIESGERIPVGVNGDSVGSGFAYLLPSGGYRYFRTYHGSIVSATSSDGLNFSDDPGIRLSGDAFQIGIPGNMVCSAIAPLANSKYRMYCTIRLTQGGPGNPGEGAIVSAVSGDLMNWIPESGVRIGPGSNLPSDAGHPAIISSSLNGNVTLVYHSYNYKYTTNDVGSIMPKNSGTNEIIVNSKDGLSFANPIITGVFGAEVAWANKNANTAFMYVGSANNVDGDIISVATAQLATKTLGLNFVDMPRDTTGGQPAVAVASVAGAICTMKVKDSGGKWLKDPRLAYKGKVGPDKVISWSWVVAGDTKQGTALAVATCASGKLSRTRQVNFQILN